MWFKTGLLLAVLGVALVHVAQGLSVSQSRIVGGEPAPASTYKFYVRLHKDGRFICGGTLVRDNAVVTAAHCIVNGTVSQFTIHAGTIFLSNPGITRKVKAVRRPVQYDSTTKNFDVAVLILESPMPSSAISTVALQTDPVAIGTNCLILGHGLTSEDGSVAKVLQKAWVPITSTSQCQARYSGVTTLTENMFCASVPGVRDSCSGDSGGPMICNNRLTGIVSFGVGCAQRYYPGVYTVVKRVAGYIEYQLELFA